MKTIKIIIALGLLIGLVTPVSNSYGVEWCNYSERLSEVIKIKDDQNKKYMIPIIKKSIEEWCGYAYASNPLDWSILHSILGIKDKNLFSQRYPDENVIKDQPTIKTPKLYWRTQFNWALAKQSFYVNAVPSELFDLGKITYKTVFPSFGCAVEPNGLVTIEDITIKGRCLIVAFIEEFIFGEGTSVHVKYIPTVSEELIIPVYPVPVKTNVVKEKRVVSKNKKGK